MKYNPLDDKSVYFQDIFIQQINPIGTALGELNFTPINIDSEKNTEKDRLFAHIEYLMTETGLTHLANNADATKKIKESRKNYITRLLTHEFSFYTKQPFTLDEFKKLLEHIEKSAIATPENVHLLLSSFAVITPDNKIASVILYVQCGKKPSLRAFAKATTSTDDPTYKAGREILQFADSLPIADTENFKFLDSSIIECHATEGHLYICIDDCLDYKYQRAQTELNEFINEKLASEEYLAFLCSHVVTSNFIQVHPDNYIADITHADAKTPFKAYSSNMRPLFYHAKFGPSYNVFQDHPVRCNVLPEEIINRINKHTHALAKKNGEVIENRIIDYLIQNLIEIENHLPRSDDPPFRLIIEVVSKINTLTDMEKLYLDLEKLVRQIPTPFYYTLFISMHDILLEQTKKILSQTEEPPNNFFKKIELRAMSVENAELIQKLENAILQNNQPLLSELLESGINPNSDCSNGDTLLTLALQNANTEIAHMIIKYGADVNKENKKHITPLEATYSFNHPNKFSTMSFLTSMGAKLLSKEVKSFVNKAYANDTEFRIFYQCRVYSWFPNQVEALIANEKVKYIKYLLNSDIPLEKCEDYLMLAIKKGSPEIVKMFLNKINNVNLIVRDDNTPLTLAIHLKYFKVAKILLENGADVNVRNSAEDTPLIQAVIGGDLNMSSLLIAHGAQIDESNSDGYSALAFAESYEHVDIINLLLQNNAKMDSQFKQKSMWLAVKHNRIDTVQLLLERKISFSAVWDDKTALQLAQEKNLNDIVGLFELMQQQVTIETLKNKSVLFPPVVDQKSDADANVSKANIAPSTNRK